ncbi:hypothetical protein C8J57DRAFT_986400, partial [Mycena rebaudengoi]
IILQCERLGSETNCWLLIAANTRSHTTSVLHYVTPAMRTEALKESTAMINDFQSVTGALKRARRQEAMKLSEELIQMEKAKLEAEQLRMQAVD